jgi:hypothetical protein
MASSVCVVAAVSWLHGCNPPAARRPAGPARAPVIAPSDTTWARLSRSCPADAPIRLAAPRAPPPAGRVRTRDDHAAELARRVPGGYGGLYVEYDPPLQPDGAIRFETRRAVVFLVDTTQRDAALRALSSTAHSEQLPLNVVHARTRAARWSFAELYDWYGLLNNIVWREGVVSSDIDEKQNRIVYAVENAAGRERLERRLAPLDLPCFLVGVASPALSSPDDGPHSSSP